MDSDNSSKNIPEKIKLTCSQDVKKWHEETDGYGKYKAWSSMRDRMYSQANQEQINHFMWAKMVDDDMAELDKSEDVIEKVFDKVLRKYNISQKPAEIRPTVEIYGKVQCCEESCSNAKIADAIKATLQYIHDKSKPDRRHCESLGTVPNHPQTSVAMHSTPSKSRVTLPEMRAVTPNIANSPSASATGNKTHALSSAYVSIANPCPKTGLNGINPIPAQSSSTNCFQFGNMNSHAAPAIPNASTNTDYGYNGSNIFARTKLVRATSSLPVQTPDAADTAFDPSHAADSSPAIVPRVPDHLRLPCKPSKFVSTYRSIQSPKRGGDDNGDDGHGGDAKRSREHGEEEPLANRCDFKTGTEELKEQYAKKYGNSSADTSTASAYAGGRTLGARAGRNVRSKFVPPVANEQQRQQRPPVNMYGQHNSNHNNGHRDAHPQSDSIHSMDADNLVSDDERLRNIEPSMIERIQNEIMHKHSAVDWDSIAGLDYAKTIIKEAVIWPMIRPELFRGLRRPPKGILLFGPPGTGKTMIGKCIASQANATFFSISASSLTSKWIGEGEKMVRALFAVANVHQPSVIFVDEIDSLLCQRSDTEHESSRRLKTEFLVQLDGATTSDNDRVLIVGATNRPQELDEAARRRLVKRLYIPLPEQSAREQMLFNLLKPEKVAMSREQLADIARLTDGYSGADMKALCSEAAMGPIREITATSMFTINPENVRSMSYQDLAASLKCVKATVSPKDLNLYVEWNKTFGSGLGV